MAPRSSAVLLGVPMRSLSLAAIMLVLVTACVSQIMPSVDKVNATNDSAEITRCQEGYTQACKRVQAMMDAQYGTQDSEPSVLISLGGAK